MCIYGVAFFQKYIGYTVLKDRISEIQLNIDPRSSPPTAHVP